MPQPGVPALVRANATRGPNTSAAPFANRTSMATSACAKVPDPSSPRPRTRRAAAPRRSHPRAPSVSPAHPRPLCGDARARTAPPRQGRIARARPRRSWRARDNRDTAVAVRGGHGRRHRPPRASGFRGPPPSRSALGVFSSRSSQRSERRFSSRSRKRTSASGSSATRGRSREPKTRARRRSRRCARSRAHPRAPGRRDGRRSRGRR